jgi:formamidopyrimidine-DNA glycosylase
VAPPGLSFTEALRGERIDGVGRRGKFIVVQFGSGRRLTVHLRMTGRLIVQAPEVSEPHPYTHIRLTFVDGWRLCFADVRQFGRMRLLAAEEAWDADGGVEPLS